MPHRVSIAPAILLQTAHTGPPIVANPLQEAFGRTTTQAIAGIAEELSRQLDLGGAATAPEAYPPRDPQHPIRPHGEDDGEAIHRLALSAGVHPGQASHCRRKGFWYHRVINDEIPSLPHEQCASGAL
jgi:hypothetical protein